MWRILAGLAALIILGTTPARAEWRRAESPSFVLYGDLPESALRARILQLEDFDRLLRLLTVFEEPPAENKLHIYIVSGHDALDRVGEVPQAAGGFYTATPYGITAVVDNRVESAGNLVLFHEYAHHFLLRSGAPYPAWFVEGFAEYFATARFAARSIDFGRANEGRGYAAAEAVWLPMERVLSAGPDGLNPEQGATYYAQSWLLTHYFYSNAERQAAMGRFLSALRSRPPAEALQSATGLTFATLTTELRRYIARGRITYRQMTRASAGTPPAVTVTMLPRSAADMMLYEAALGIGLPESRQANYLLRIREAAARHPDDPLAMRVQAHAEALYGDPAAADRLLDRLLAAAPNDAELLYLKGMRWLAAAESDDPPEDAALTARRWFTRAFAADANHYQTLYRYAQTLRGEDDFRSDNTRNVLLRARRLAPQVSEITLNAASLLMSRHDYGDAILILQPLAQSPHDAALARRAREMIAEAEARQREPVAGSADAPRR